VTAFDPSVPESAPASVSTTTRRAILGAGLGALLATIAGALGRPQSALGANGDPITVGNATTGSSTTVLLSSEPTNAALSVVNTSTGNAYHGGAQQGSTFVAFNQAGNGFDGQSKTGNGVKGRQRFELRRPGSEQ